MIIDFHTHIFPDALAARAIPMLAERSGFVPQTDGTVSGLLASMREAGIGKSVALSIATNAHQNKKVNDFVLSLQDDRLIPFGSVHYEADWQYELDRLADGGIKGIKLHPDYQGFFIDDPAMCPIYEYILKKDMILLFHAGQDDGLPNPIHASPDRTARVLGMFTGEKVVLAHLGGFRQWDEVEQYLLGRDIYLDLSCTTPFMDSSRLTRLLRGHDSNKLLFATDCPWGNQKNDVAAISALDLEPHVKQGILGGNAARLLGL